MKLQQVLDNYDEDYAKAYDERFLLAKHAKTAFEAEVGVVSRLLESDGKWLDVACGTGRLLSRFGGLARAGLDISPAMLEQAGRLNPDALFLREWDFREPMPEWENEFSLVTCMWYAYGLVESISEVERVIRNMASWTSEHGVCFIPVWDPRNLSKRIRIPFLHKDRFYGGDVQITGVTWTWIEASGKRHENMVAPHLEYMVAMFKQYFAEVSVVSYPLAKGWRSPKRTAIKATAKRKD